MTWLVLIALTMSGAGFWLAYRLGRSNERKRQAESNEDLQGEYAHNEANKPGSVDDFVDRLRKDGDL
ncbi:MAG: hypothetical protein CMF31_04995 [Kordiimonas sp.]|nr:hypothetical protein [Kordiimonas sp.]